MSLRLAAVLSALTMLVACGGSGADPQPAGAGPTSVSSTSTSTPTSTPSPREPSPAPASRSGAAGRQIVAGPSEFGTILFDRTGQAIYLFDVEKTSRPRCYGSCATDWPPVLSRAAARAGTGVDQALLGTVRRTDGARQVTYAGHPLYFYAHEGENEVRCHDVFLNGGTWYAVQPDGDRAP